MNDFIARRTKQAEAKIAFAEAQAAADVRAAAADHAAKAAETVLRDQMQGARRRRSRGARNRGRQEPPELKPAPGARPLLIWRAPRRIVRARLASERTASAPQRGTTGMVRAIIGFLALLGAVSLAHAASGPAEDSIYGTPAEARWAPFHANFANVPACDDPSVLSTITGRFGETENTYWGGVHADRRL